MTQLRYKVLMQDEDGYTLARMSSPSFAALSLQGPLSAARRLKHAALADRRLHQELPEHVLAPWSLQSSPDNGVCSVLFAYRRLSCLQDFLLHADDKAQYAAGRRCGFVLQLVHRQMLPARQKAAQWQEQVKAELTAYFSSPLRFAGDRLTLRSLQERLNFLLKGRTVFTLGTLRAATLLLSSDGKIVLHPLVKALPAPSARDFAPLCAQDGVRYPCFAAGVVDGYLGKRDPTAFWLELAVYCAYYATAGLCAKLTRAQQRIYAQGSGMTLSHLEQLLRTAERQSLNLRTEFADFTYPIPLWYQQARVNAARRIVLAQGL